MISSDIIRLITELEHEFPVEQWRVDGIRIWPLVRIKLYGYLYAFRIDAENRQRNESEGLGLVASRGASAVSGLGRYLRACLADFRHNRRARDAADIAFLSDGVSYALVDGEWYEKFCDPLIARLEQRSMRCFLMSPLREYFVPRHSPSMFVQPFVDLAIARALVRSRLPGASLRNLPRFEQFCAGLATRDLGIPLGRVLTIGQDAARLRSVASYYKKQLERLRPKAAFIVSYYSIDGMAFNLACHELGIPAVDIQHGAEGDLNPAYGQWHKVPPEGYALLPAVFWCWSETEAAAIRRWNGAVRDRHNAVVGGHPWLMLWQGGRAPFVARYDQEMRTRKATGSYRRHILVTLQYGLADESVLAPVLEAVRTAPRDWCWWVRLHPCMPGEREAIRRMLRERGSDRVELDAASDLPLYALLRHMDAHVTHSSYTVVEADAYGVPSVVFSAYGAELFSEQIASGAVTVAENGTALSRAIEQSLARRAAGNAPAHPQADVDPDRAIDEILELKARGAMPVCGPAVAVRSARLPA